MKGSFEFKKMVTFFCSRNSKLTNLFFSIIYALFQWNISISNEVNHLAINNFDVKILTEKEDEIKLIKCIKWINLYIYIYIYEFLP